MAPTKPPKKKSGKRADVRARTTFARPPEEEPREAVRPSEPQEIDFLPRREGVVWSLSDIARMTQAARELLEDGDKDAGRRAWRFGDKLTELYNGFPERAQGYPSFVAWAKATFDLSREDVYEYLRARRRVENADEAHKLGRERMRLGFRLLDRLEIETFETLAKRDLLLPDDHTCRFPATVRALRAALKLLSKPVPATPSRRLASEAAGLNEILRLARLEEPDLANATIEYVVLEGEVVLENGPLGRLQRLALSKFILKAEDPDD